MSVSILSVPRLIPHKAVSRRASRHIVAGTAGASAKVRFHGLAHSSRGSKALLAGLIANVRAAHSREKATNRATNQTRGRGGAVMTFSAPAYCSQCNRTYRFRDTMPSLCPRCSEARERLVELKRDEDRNREAMRAGAAPSRPPRPRIDVSTEVGDRRPRPSQGAGRRGASVSKAEGSPSWMLSS
jgi:hypothetical protein